MLISQVRVIAVIVNFEDPFVTWFTHIYMYIIIAPISRLLYAIRIKRLGEYVMYLRSLYLIAHILYHYLPPKNEERRVSRLTSNGEI